MIVDGKLEKGCVKSIGMKRYDILKVAHHGSKDSSSERFLQKVRPKIAVISCGENNSYGHPHKEVFERLDECGTDKVYVTKESGQVKVWCEDGKLKVKVFC